ncbi:MAG: 4-hydroxy-tetrahydrodipicolinate reductase [Lachnospiraceae bacterium]|nr:4-hydroxy-tetrahydrodipicolinate reductase [Lachnospiraceae bacterium]
MVNMIMHGCNGRMGKMIVGIVAADPDITIVAGVDINTEEAAGFPVYDSIDKVTEEADAVVDFGNAAAVDAVIDWCVAKKIPLVECTTGLSDETLARLKDASGKVAMFKSANMSLGINIIQKILKENSAQFAEAGFDVEIVEKHHRTKLDAPSGTALALADSVNEGLEKRKDYVFDRSQRRMVRPDTEIGISAVRGGTIVGDHDVIFAGQDEVITFSHTAYSRAVFAKGAVEAAKFVKGRGPGMYDMSDVVGR